MNEHQKDTSEETRNDNTMRSDEGKVNGCYSTDWTSNPDRMSAFRHSLHLPRRDEGSSCTRGRVGTYMHCSARSHDLSVTMQKIQDKEDNQQNGERKLTPCPLFANTPSPIACHSLQSSPLTSRVPPGHRECRWRMPWCRTSQSNRPWGECNWSFSTKISHSRHSQKSEYEMGW